MDFKDMNKAYQIGELYKLFNLARCWECPMFLEGFNKNLNCYHTPFIGLFVFRYRVYPNSNLWVVKL